MEHFRYILRCMLMVIFGAGASYDSSPTHPAGPTTEELESRPPLAKDLFSNRPLFTRALDYYPQCKKIVPRLRDPAVMAGQTSIEACLQEIEKEAETYARGRQEMAAIRCYLQRAIADCQSQWRSTTRGVTNYLSLLREIERLSKEDRPVCLVTFNYDTILEEALEDLGHGIKSIAEYTKEDRFFRVFKLHGSVNWGQELDSALEANINPNAPIAVLQHLVEHAAEMEISNRFVLCEVSRMGTANGRPVFPAIAVPIERKGRFQCPEYMIDNLAALLPRVNKVMMIGWRATEEHFLELLRQHLPRGVFISIVAGGREDADQIRVHINRALASKSPSARAEATGFTELMRTRLAQRVIGATT